MPDDIQNTLYKAALAVMANAYAPYSRFTVGSALVAEDGSLHAGCNVETVHYKGICAEASAISALVSAGRRLIRDIAVVGPDERLCSPCGDCRQRIREFADARTRVHVFARSGTLLRSYTMDELLPDSFGPDNLGKAG